MTGEDDDNEGMSAFLATMEDPQDSPEKPAEGTKAPTESPTTGEDTEGSQGAFEGATEGSQEEGAEADPDDAEVDVKVGEKAEKVKLRDLKQHFAQRAETERATREAAERRQLADHVHTATTTAYNKLLERAKSRLAEFNQYDYVILGQELSREELTYLRQAHAAAAEEVQFLENEFKGAATAAQQVRQTEIQRAAQACVSELSGRDAEKSIPGFNQQLFQELCQFATSRGVSAPLLAQLTDPGAFRVIHDAMQYRKGLAKATTQTKKVEAKPTKMLKSSGTEIKPDHDAKALDRLRKSGSQDDATAAFLADLSKHQALAE